MMLMNSDEGFGVKCIVTVDPGRPVKDTALLCVDNPLGLTQDQYCWIKRRESVTAVLRHVIVLRCGSGIAHQS
jgi:hypothetical protein